VQVSPKPKILPRMKLMMVIVHTTLMVLIKRMKPEGLVKLVTERIKQMTTALGQAVIHIVLIIALVIALVIARIGPIIALVIARIGPIIAKPLTKVSALFVSLQPGIRLSPGLFLRRYTLRMCLRILRERIRSDILPRNNL
jgi:hypothetical protein